MTFRPDHELHKRRKGRNIGVGLVLVGFVALVFLLTVVKVERGGSLQGFDHTQRIDMVPQGSNK
ncbi:hypothetical protein [Donghicola tyrosinivorans]|jgi:hypothetical protein|uniref:Cytochrome C oxidase assembly protein n=1 Tax=Donghicola tyrosinivorans TaxID=1652492 RepID=A0A2T0W9K7_9RHOB|nr:hypothetical protein [Donghicola tyrosinivorans]MEC9197420.1 hypothetical protein [Pseudomonadota bacterium]PRY83373.1 hypothetical protein CLV74_1317 [Donghicola tyrosinivorans]